jgi:hypothetical protein
MGHSAHLRAQQLSGNEADSCAQIRADPASIMGAKRSISSHLVETSPECYGLYIRAGWNAWTPKAGVL